MPLYIVPPLLRPHLAFGRQAHGPTCGLRGPSGGGMPPCPPTWRLARASVLRLGARAARHASAAAADPWRARRLGARAARHASALGDRAHPPIHCSASGAGATWGWRRSAAGSDAGRGPARTCLLTSPLPTAADSAADAGRGPARTCLPCLDALALAITVLFCPPAAAVPALPRHGADCPDRPRPRRGAMSRGRRPHGPSSPVARRACCCTAWRHSCPRRPDRLFAPLRILSAAPALPLRLGLRATPLESPRAALQGLAVLAPRDVWNCTQWRLFGRKFGAWSGDRAPTPLQNCYIALFGRRRTWALASGLQPAPAGPRVRLAARPIGRRL